MPAVANHPVVSRTRDPWLDNVKMILVTLVVVGHSWGLATSRAPAETLYDFVYFWHMPAFVLVTGYLSRGFQWNRKGFVSLVTTCAVPYLIFEAGLFYYRAALGQPGEGPVWLIPHWSMWYLCVLFFWRLATPVLRGSAWWIPASVVISLAAGLWSLQELAFCRFFAMLPFFVIGLHLRSAHLDRLRDPRLRLPAWLALGGIAVLATTLDSWASTDFLWYDQGYAALGASPLDGARIRLTVLLVGLLGAAAAVTLVPRGRSRLSTMGGASLVVYLFHGFVVRTAEAAGVDTWAAGHAWLGLLATTVGALALALLLASRPVAAALTRLVDPLARLRRPARDGDPDRASDLERDWEWDREWDLDPAAPYGSRLPDQTRADLVPTSVALR